MEEIQPVVLTKKEIGFGGISLLIENIRMWIPIITFNSHNYKFWHVWPISTPIKKTRSDRIQWQRVLLVENS